MHMCCVYTYVCIHAYACNVYMLAVKGGLAAQTYNLAKALAAASISEQQRKSVIDWADFGAADNTVALSVVCMRVCIYIHEFMCVCIYIYTHTC